MSSFLKSQTLILVGLIAAAAYLYFFNLNGAMISMGDENRAFHYNSYSPLFYLISSPLVHFFKRFDMPFYLMATFGFINVILLYRVVKAFFNKRLALLALGFYVFYDYPLCYAKQLYYSTMLITYVLLAMLVIRFAVRKLSLAMTLAGALMALMFVTNPSSYVLILALLIFTGFCMKWEGKPVKFLSLLYFGVLMAAGFAITAAGLEFWMTARYPGQGFFENLIGYRESVVNIKSPIELGFQSLLWRAEQLFASSLKSGSQVFRNGFVVLSVCVAIWFGFKRRDQRYLGFLCFTSLAVGVYLAANVIGLHTSAFRQFVWMSIFIAISFAIGISYLWEYSKLRKPLIGILIVYFALAIVQSFQATHSLVSWYTIEQYLEDHNIQKSRVASTWPLSTYQNALAQKRFKPLMLRAVKDPDPMYTGIYYHVNWQILLRQHQAGQIDYCLLSGYGPYHNVGLGDQVLEGVKPIAEWPHPLNNRYLHFIPFNVPPADYFAMGSSRFLLEHDLYIRLYRMEDIVKNVVLKSLTRGK